MVKIRATEYTRYYSIITHSRVAWLATVEIDDMILAMPAGVRGVTHLINNQI